MKQKHVAAFVFALFVFALAHAWVITVTGALVLVAGYLIDVRVRPRVACGTCGGRGRRYGWLLDWGQSRCLDCGGRQAHVRWGARVFGSAAARAEYEAQRRAKAAGYRRLDGRWGNWQPAALWSRWSGSESRAASQFYRRLVAAEGGYGRVVWLWRYVCGRNIRRLRVGLISLRTATRV